MGYLVPMIMLAGLGLMAYFMMKGNKQQALWLKDTSNQHSWESKTKSEGAPGVYQISGTSKDGKKWELNSYSRSSAEDRNAILHHSREYTEWTYPLTHQRGEIIAMPRDPSWKSFSDDQILGFIKPVWKAMGLPAEQFIAYPGTNKEIKNKYMIYTTSDDLSLLILNDVLIKLLLGWQDISSVKNSLVNIRISSKEISLQLGYLINTPKEVEKLVLIGEKIIESLQQNS